MSFIQHASAILFVGVIAALTFAVLPWFLYHCLLTVPNRVARAVVFVVVGTLIGYLIGLSGLLLTANLWPGIRPFVLGHIWVLNAGAPVGLLLGGAAALRSWRHTPGSREAP